MSTQISPVVSVITATRNRSDLLECALKSIAGQTMQDFEAIVIDDWSDIPTLEKYQRIWASLDSRFILVPPKAPGAFGTGPADARNRGIDRARGEFIAFLDDDDEWVTKDHLEVGLNALRQWDGDFYFANMRGYRDDKITRADWFHHAPYLKTQRLADLPSVYEVSRPHVARALQHNVIHPDVMIVRKELVRQFGGFLKHGWMAEDCNFAYHVADRSQRTFYRADVVAKYRFPVGNSVSLTVSQNYFRLFHLAYLHEIRLNCQHRELRKAARAQESWLYRTFALEQADKCQGREAVALAWQGLCTYPTLGAIATFVKVLCCKLGLRRPPKTVTENGVSNTEV